VGESGWRLVVQPARAPWLRLQERSLTELLRRFSTAAFGPTDVTSTGSAQGFTSTVTHGHLTLKRPNLMHAVCTGQMFGRVPFGDCVCDGTNVYALVPGNKLYLKLPITGGLHVVARGLTGIGGDSYPLFFYGVGNTLRASIKLGTLRQAGRLTIDGITCQGLEAEATFAKHTRLIYYIGTDNLVHGEDMVTKERGNTVTVRSRMTRLRVNAAVASEEFVFHAPAGAREHPVGQF
jgi:hypothetical protein